MCGRPAGRRAPLSHIAHPEVPVGRDKGGRRDQGAGGQEGERGSDERRLGASIEGAPPSALLLQLSGPITVCSTLWYHGITTCLWYQVVPRNPAGMVPGRILFLTRGPAIGPSLPPLPSHSWCLERSARNEDAALDQHDWPHGMDRLLSGRCFTPDWHEERHGRRMIRRGGNPLERHRIDNALGGCRGCAGAGMWFLPTRRGSQLYGLRPVGTTISLPGHRPRIGDARRGTRDAPVDFLRRGRCDADKALDAPRHRAGTVAHRECQRPEE